MSAKDKKVPTAYYRNFNRPAADARSARRTIDARMRSEGFADEGGFILRRIVEMTSGSVLHSFVLLCFLFAFILLCPVCSLFFFLRFIRLSFLFFVCIYSSLLIYSFFFATRRPESFVATRAQFARSLAALTVASYVLGIGDRHCDNFLMSQRCGSLVGIDFGCAFGDGLALSVPELIPFRFSPQFTRVLAPLHGRNSLARRSMVHALRALRAGAARDALLATLDTFVREPTLEWSKKTLARERKLRAEHGDGATAEARVSVPEERLATVRRKLLGHNPSAVMEEEFRRGKSSSISRVAGLEASIVKCMWGEVGSRRRAVGNAECCDAATQVELLCEMATDVNITTRAYVGLVLWA